MNAIAKFVLNTITGGILFLLPLTFLYIILKKVHAIMQKLLSPISNRLPDDIFGLDGHQLISILILILVCFFAGLLFRSRLLSGLISKLEDGVLSMLPGYTFVKSMAADALNQDGEDTMQPALVEQGEAWQFVLIIEERDGFCTVFLPETPDPKVGTILVYPSASLKRLDIPSNSITKAMKRLGKGSLDNMLGNKNGA